MLVRIVKEAKQHFGRKLESQFQLGGSRSLWQRLRTITNFKTLSFITMNVNVTLADELNTVYACFNAVENSTNCSANSAKSNQSRNLGAQC